MSLRSNSIRAAAAFVAALAAAAFAPPPAAANTATAAEQAAQGRRIYTSNCARCHGLNMVTTGAAYDLRTFPADQKDRFVRSIVHGVRAMPAWGDKFKPEELDALWAYVTTR